MEILIIGAGAMGSLFATMLAPYAKVSLLTTNADHAEAIRRDGLMITRLDGTQQRVRVGIRLQPDRNERPFADLVLVCTKAGSTAAAAHTARACVQEEGLVLTLQNGLGNVEQIASVVGERQTLAGTTAQAATLVGPGQVRHAGSGPTHLACLPGQNDKVEAIAALFNRAGIPCDLVEDVNSLLWSKLIVNVGINALAAVLRVPNGMLAEIPECAKLMTKAVEEALAVARALHIDLAYEEQMDRVRQVCRMTSSNRASMLQDMLRGKPTEIDAINGAIVAKGLETHIPTPVNTFLTQVVKALEATTSCRI